MRRPDPNRRPSQANILSHPARRSLTHPTAVAFRLPVQPSHPIHQHPGSITAPRYGDDATSGHDFELGPLLLVGSGLGRQPMTGCFQRCDQPLQNNYLFSLQPCHGRKDAGAQSFSQIGPD
jgi:hypothetical protein